MCAVPVGTGSAMRRGSMHDNILSKLKKEGTTILEGNEKTAITIKNYRTWEVGSHV